MFTLDIQPRFSEIDGLGHVNNTKVPVWFEEARTPFIKFFNPNFDYKVWDVIIAHISVDFVEQMYLHNPVLIKSWVEKVGNSSFNLYHEAWQDNELKAKGKDVIVHFDFVNKKSIVIPAEIQIKLEEHLIDVPVNYQPCKS